MTIILNDYIYDEFRFYQYRFGADYDEKKNLLLEDWVFRLVWVFSRYSFFVPIKIDDYVGELTTLFGFRFK